MCCSWWGYNSEQNVEESLPAWSLYCVKRGDKQWNKQNLHYSLFGWQ